MSITAGTILKVVCTLVHTDTSVLQNVFNVVADGDNGPWDAVDIVDDMVDWVEDMYTNILAYISDEIDASEVTVYEYDSVDDDWDEVGSAVPTLTFTASGGIMPRGTGLLINAKTVDPDVNGKKYLGVFTDGHWVDGAWAAGLLTNAAAFAVDWYTTFVGAAGSNQYDPVIWSPTHTVAKLMSGTIIIPTSPAYQRRRKPGVGI
jgi:hypothetical protein